LTSDLAESEGLPVNLKGVYVDRITENGLADKADIHGSRSIYWSTQDCRKRPYFNGI
jgi:hypothetical protein